MVREIHRHSEIYVIESIKCLSTVLPSMLLSCPLRFIGQQSVLRPHPHFGSLLTGQLRRAQESC